MADKKIIDLAAASTVVSTDILPIVVDPSGAAAIRKATVAQIVSAGGSSGYTILLATAANVNPPDATTLLRGGDLLAASTETYDQVKVEVPKAGTIKRVSLKVRVSGTLGSGETVSHYIRLNDTTDVGQIDTTYDAATRNVVNTSVSQAVVAGDFIALKIVGPTWATNPTNVRWYCLVYIE